MQGWESARLCSENYRSDNGKPACHPHYTWGALLPLIGVEALCDIDAHFNPRPYPACGIDGTITLRNIPFGGTLYRIDVAHRNVRVSPEV